MAHEEKINYEANGNQEFFIADNDFDNQLIEAVKQNNIQKIKDTFFRNSYNQKLLDTDGKSLVMIAVEQVIQNLKNIETLDSLLDRECASNILDKTNRTPLYVAAKAGNSVIVNKLLDTGMYNIDKHHEDHGTALFAAIKNGHLKIAELLLQKGANLNIQSFPVEELIKSNSVETLKYFIKFSKKDQFDDLLEECTMQEFAASLNNNLLTVNNLNLAAQNQEMLELLLSYFIDNDKIALIRTEMNGKLEFLVKVLQCIIKNEKLLTPLITPDKPEFFKLLLDNAIISSNITSIELEKILSSINEKLLGKEAAQKFNADATKNIIKEFIENFCKTNPTSFDKIQVLVNHIAKFGNENDFNNLYKLKDTGYITPAVREVITKQLLDHSFLELAIKSNLSIVDEIVQNTLINGDIQAVRSLLEFANKNEYLKPKLADGSLLIIALQSGSKNKLEIVKDLVQNGSSISVLDYKLAANNKDLEICAYLKEKAGSDIITPEVIKTAKQNYDSKIKSLFGDFKITSASSFLEFQKQLAQYFDSDTTNPHNTIEIQAEFEKSAFSVSMLGE